MMDMEIVYRNSKYLLRGNYLKSAREAADRVYRESPWQVLRMNEVGCKLLEAVESTHAVSLLYEKGGVSER